MAQTDESPVAQDAAGLSGMQFPGRKSIRESNENPTSIQEAIVRLKREFAVECCRIAGVKALHAADNLLLLDDLNAERDLRIATRNLREARSS